MNVLVKNLTMITAPKLKQLNMQETMAGTSVKTGIYAQIV